MSDVKKQKTMIQQRINFATSLKNLLEINIMLLVLSVLGMKKQKTMEMQ